MRRNHIKNSAVYFLFLVPAIAFFTAFFLVPFFKSIWLSFTNAGAYNPNIHFVGFSNYGEALSNEDFRNSVAVTLKYTLLVTAAANIVSLGLALLLDGSLHCRKLFRTVFFLPNLMSLVIVSFVWVFLYGGVYQSFAELCSIPEAWRISWLGNRNMALVSMSIMAVWQCAGYYMLIYIAGLQSIPEELSEAASIDGASRWKIVVKIKCPLLAPVVFMNTILLITAGLKTFDIPLAMTSGGPAGATTTIALQIYNTGFRTNRTGYATAQSVILFLIISAVTAILYLVQNRKEKETE